VQCSPLAASTIGIIEHGHKVVKVIRSGNSASRTAISSET
jgi:hypothetical protein